MKILVVSDEQAKALDEQFNLERWRQVGIELVLSCGDLPAEYLDFLIDVFRVPLYYVKGNHDCRWAHQPAGEDIDGRIVEFNKLKILGIQGSPWYNGNALQYSEQAMAWKLKAIQPKLWVARHVDIIIAHSAPQFCPDAYRLCEKPVGVGRQCPFLKEEGADAQRICQDASDYAHRGFASYRDLILKFNPRFFFHGHRHQTYGLGKRELRIGQTRVIDTFGHVVLDI